MPGTLGILLAGGRGSRLGGDLPKALVRVGGESLFDRAARELSRACDEIVVVLPEGFALETSIARVNDVLPRAGPLSALVAGLESREFDRALALGVDFPSLDRARLRQLLGAHRAGPATVPAPGGRPQPLAAVYEKSAAVPLRAALESGARGVVAAVCSLGPRLLEDSDLLAIGLDPLDFADLDTPEDLEGHEARRRGSA